MSQGPGSRPRRQARFVQPLISASDADQSSMSDNDSNVSSDRPRRRVKRSERDSSHSGSTQGSSSESNSEDNIPLSKLQARLRRNAFEDKYLQDLSEQPSMISDSDAVKGKDVDLDHTSSQENSSSHSDQANDNNCQNNKLLNPPTPVANANAPSTEEDMSVNFITSFYTACKDKLLGHSQPLREPFIA